MKLFLLTLFVFCAQRIYCDVTINEQDYYEKPKKSKASLGLTLDIEKEEVYLKKHPDQVVLVLGDNGSKDYKDYHPHKEHKEYHSPKNYHGDYHKNDYHKNEYHDVHSEYLSHGALASLADNHKSYGHHGGKHYGPHRIGPNEGVYIDHGDGNGLIVETGPHAYEYGGAYRKRFGDERPRMGYHPKMGQAVPRLVQDLNYASAHNRYSALRLKKFIPNEYQSYDY